MTPNYTLVRSDRRTLSMEITNDLTVLVRAPRRCPHREIDRFVDSHEDWCASHIEKRRNRLEEHPEPTPTERAELIRRAKTALPVRVEFYAEIMGLYPESVKITSAEKRFGSCSPKNGICFSWRLMRYPDDAIDYVVVHELAHIAQKNHGREFYGLVASVMPDYKERRALLKN
ncbi:MAG: M48 family peptidase [Clostridia bacterium]|nr:M48 family peptidase [Clostridia bacterium]NCC69095.1 M48 family peptidase [Clostridia bacterium]